MKRTTNPNLKNQFPRKHSNGLRLAFLTLAALFVLTGVSAWAGAFTSAFPAPNAPSGVTLYGNAAILGAGGLQLNPPSQGSSGAAVVSDLDVGLTVKGFSLTAGVTTTNGGGNNPADGFGIYFSAPGVVPVGSYQNYENLGVGSGVALLVSDFSGTISIETGTHITTLSLPSRAILVGKISVSFSYDPIDGGVFTLTGSDNNQYVVSASAAQLAANGLSFQSGDIFTLGGRVGYPGAANSDTHIINSLAITTYTASGGAAPVITSDLTNLTLGVGQAAQFAVSASGVQPLNYQWFTNTVADPAGINASYALTSVATTDNGRTFRVIITNSYGSATSHVATLTVLAAPTISGSGQPAGQSVNENSTASFSVTAGGQAPLYYQWLTNGVPIAGAINSSYTTPPVHPAPYNNMQFKVIVTNSVGSITSSVAILTVVADTTPPTVTSIVGDPSLEDVTVTFSETVSAATALNTGNYKMNNGVSITSASFGANSNIVLLQTTPMGTNYYTLGISGIQDLAQTPNTMTATNVMFYASPALVISDTTFEADGQPNSGVYGYGYASPYDPGEPTAEFASYQDPFINATNGPSVFQFQFDSTADAAVFQNPGAYAGVGFGMNLNYNLSNVVNFVSTNLHDYTYSFDARVEGLLPGVSNDVDNVYITFDPPLSSPHMLQLDFNFTVVSNWTHYVFHLDQGSVNNGSVAAFIANLSSITNLEFGAGFTIPGGFGFDRDNAVYIDNILLTCVYPAPPFPTVENPIAQINFDNYPATTSGGFVYAGATSYPTFTGNSAVTTAGVGGTNALEESCDNTPLFNNPSGLTYSGFAAFCNGPVQDASQLNTGALNVYKCYFDARADGLTAASVTSAFDLTFLAPDGTTGAPDGNADTIIKVEVHEPVTANWQTFSFTLDNGTITDGSQALFNQYVSQITTIQPQLTANDAYNDFAEGNIDLVIDNIKLVRVKTGLPAVNIGVSNNHLVVQWSGSSAVLESSTNVSGPYVVVPGAVTPYTVPMTNHASFFRTIWMPTPP